MSLPSVAWIETTPAGADVIPTGDDDIREMKAQIRELFGYNHKLEQGNDASFGYHTQAMFLVQGADPSHVADTMVLFAKDISAKAELHFVKTDDTLVQLTAVGQFISGFTNEIRIYDGLLADIPTGWALCDGDGGRPEMTDYFVRSAVLSTTTPGTNVDGGTITLTANNLVPHTHTVNLEEGGEHSDHRYNTYITTNLKLFGFPPDLMFGSMDNQTAQTGGNTHSHAITVSESFAGSALTIAPSYYEVAFIIRS